MSTIYKFQDSEPTLTPGSTATPLLATDPVLVYSSNLGRTIQASIGSVASLLTATTATSLTTATVITPFGVTSVTPSSITSFTLADPSQVGVYKTLLDTTSSSTNIAITTASATINATETTFGSVITFSAKGAYLELVSRTTGVWGCVGRSATGVLISSV